MLRTLALGLLALSSALPLACAYPNRVFLIRHGEKPSSGSGLSQQGEERAQCLVNVFSQSAGYNIGLMLAETPQPDGTQQRPYDTVAPLAQSLGLTVDTACERDDAQCVADAVADFAQSSGADVLICWEHNELTDISADLGDSFTYPGTNFNLIYEIVDGQLTANSPYSENCPGLDDSSSSGSSSSSSSS